MKYRSDFVTNSSDSSFVVDNIDNPLFDSLKSKLNIDYKLITGCGNDWYVPSVEDAQSISEWQILSILFADWDLTLACYEGGDYDESDVSEYENAILRSMAEQNLISLRPDESVVHWLDRAGLSEITESMEPLDEGIRTATIGVTRYCDGSWGPFEYVRINKGKRLNIYLSENDIGFNDHLIRIEPIQGKEYVVTGDEFKDRKRMIEYIIEHGGSVSDEFTAKTDYVVFAEPDNQPFVSKAREECIPVLSETGFWNRYSGKKLEYDPNDELVLFGDIYDRCSPRSWFEKTGLGTISRQIWKDGKWQDQE